MIWPAAERLEMARLVAQDKEAAAVVAETGIPQEAVALCYQLGTLIFPALAPVIIWVLSNWEEVEHYIGFHPSRRK